MGNLASARANMVTGQIFVSDVQDGRVLAALGEVAREPFVLGLSASVAYADVETPLNNGRALMMPLAFARLLQLAGAAADDLVLDIGCATGYSTAILAKLTGSVVAIEVDEALAAKASETLSAQGVDNAAVVIGPHEAGYPSEAPYDVIFLNGSVEAVPEGLLEQLAPGGRLVAIVGTDRAGKATVFTKLKSGIGRRAVFDAAASPLPGFVAERGFEF